MNKTFLLVFVLLVLEVIVFKLVLSVLIKYLTNKSLFLFYATNRLQLSRLKQKWIINLLLQQQLGPLVDLNHHVDHAMVKSRTILTKRDAENAANALYQFKV